MARARIYVPVIKPKSASDATLQVAASKALTFYERDGTTPFTRTIYASPTGSTTATLTTNADGEFEGWVNGACRGRVAISGVSGTTYFEALRDETTGALWATDFGAAGDGTTDDAAALQAWLDACGTLGLDGYLPGGTYKISTGLTVSKMLHIYGAGMLRSQIMLAGTVSNTTDALTVVASTSDTRGLVIRDLAIFPADSTKGRHGLVFDTSAEGSFIANASIERCYIVGTNNGRAIANTVDATPSVSMLFDTRFVGNFITGGTKLLNVADSIWWQHNLSAGANVGLELSTVNTGAAKSVISQSTFVNVGGGLWAKSNLINLSVLDNYFEQPSAMTGGAGVAALVYINATTYGDIIGVRFEGNQFSPGVVGNAVTYSVLLRNTINAVFGPNQFGNTDSGQVGIKADSGCTGTVVLPGNTTGAGTLVFANGETDLLDLTKDSGGQVTLGASGGGSDTFDLGATAMGKITLAVTSTNGDMGIGFLHGGGAAVTSVAATNLAGAGTGVTIGANSGTGIALYWTGSTYLIRNKSAGSRTVAFRIAPRFV